jgi:hypothetical protein
MSYDAEKHKVYAERCRNWARALQNTLEEGARLRMIRQFEAENGNHADYTDSDVATAAELESLSTLMDQLGRFNTGDQTVPLTNKTSMWSPFVQ